MSHEPGDVEERDDGTIVVGKNEKQRHREEHESLEEEADLDEMPDWARMLYHQNKEILEELRSSDIQVKGKGD